MKWKASCQNDSIIHNDNKKLFHVVLSHQNGFRLFWLVNCFISACMFLTWFKQDYFFTGKNYIMDIGLKAKNVTKNKIKLTIEIITTFYSWICFLQTLLDYFFRCFFISCLGSHSDGTHWFCDILEELQAFLDSTRPSVALVSSIWIRAFIMGVRGTSLFLSSSDWPRVCSLSGGDSRLMTEDSSS